MGSKITNGNIYGRRPGIPLFHQTASAVLIGRGIIKGGSSSAKNIGPFGVVVTIVY